MDTNVQHHIRVALADGLDMSRTGLKYWLEQEQDIVIVAEVGNGAELIESARTELPDVVVLNYTLPSLSPADIVTILKKEGTTSKFVVFGTDYDSKAAKVMSAGADAFIHQDEKREVFISAVRQVVKCGEVWLSPTARKFQQNITQELKILGVTPKEKTILTMINHDNKEIASRLQLAEGTVRNHISNIYFRLDVAGRKEAIQAARRLGLLDE